MALKTVVKVGGINNLSDARYCAGMGVDFLGFKVVEGQADAISPKSFQEIRGWITGPQIVAELYGIKEATSLTAIIEGFQPDFFELSLAELPVVGTRLTLPFILSLREGESLPELDVKPAYVLLSSYTSELIKLIPECEILAVVNNAEDLTHALRQTGITGVSLNGGAEIKPGLKNFDELSQILEALEEE